VPLKYNEDKPNFTSSMMSIRDDERDNLNVAVSFKVPGRGDQNYLGMLLFEEIVGNYNANSDGMAHVNSPQRQYNYLHRHLAERPGICL